MRFEICVGALPEGRRPRGVDLRLCALRTPGIDGIDAFVTEPAGVERLRASFLQAVKRKGPSPISRALPFSMQR